MKFPKCPRVRPTVKTSPVAQSYTQGVVQTFGLDTIPSLMVPINDTQCHKWNHSLCNHFIRYTWTFQVGGSAEGSDMSTHDPFPPCLFQYILNQFYSHTQCQKGNKEEITSHMIHF